MDISDGERLIAVMLADVMKHLRVSSEIDPDLVLKTLSGGQAWALRWEHEALFNTAEDDEEIVEETAEILSMCRVVEDAIARLSSIEADLIAEGDRHIFVGFHGNGEPHFAVAKTMIETLGNFEEFEDRPLDSHVPVLDKYRRQLEKFRELGAGKEKLPLFQISQIILA